MKSISLFVGWTITEYPSTVDINDHNGRIISAFAKPYDPTLMDDCIGKVLADKIKNGSLKVYGETPLGIKKFL